MYGIIEFRTMQSEDLRRSVGATDRDNAARNLEFGLRDLFQASNVKPHPEVVK
jgi:hypothetical protein